jgi:uncharacterized protein (TIGR02300 family)
MVASERPARKRMNQGQESHLARTDLGDKQVCPSCGARFYDLRKRPATCPKCSTAFDPAEESVRVKRGRARGAAHDPAYEDDEELDAKKVKKAGEDEDEEEVEETPEVDGAVEEPVLSTDEDEEEKAASGDEIPEGFSEEDEVGAAAADDDSVPMIEDEEEFPEDEIGEIPAGEEDDSGR